MSLNNNTLGNSVKASKKIAKKARRRILFRMKVLVERGETSSEEFIQAGEDFPWTYCYRDIEILKNINYIYAWRKNKKPYYLRKAFFVDK